jgi:hypothetical protein
MRLTVNQDLLDRLRQLPERAQRNLRRELVTTFKGEMQDKVDDLIEAPGPVSVPFAFGSENSRLYYVIMVNREDTTLTDGAHWIRTKIIESGFNVEVSDRLRGNLITIRNIQPNARYVFGPWLVAGHGNTGWPEVVERARPILQQMMIAKLEALWREAVKQAING